MDWTKIRVLLVETDESFANKAGRAFKHMNGRVVLSRAQTLAEARARIAAAPHDVVVAEMRLPDGTATELLTSNGERSLLPVVVLVRQGDEQEGAVAVEAGAVDCYVKNGSEARDLPRVVLRSIREWNHIVERERAEKTILQLRAQVLQFQRLVTSGLMARGVAHDVENLLTPILGYAEITLEKIPPRGNARGEIEHVIKVARLAKELVRDALDKKSDKREGRGIVDVRRVIADVLDLLRPVAPAGVEIRTGTTAEGAMIVGEATRCAPAGAYYRSIWILRAPDVRTGLKICTSV
jgi:signal transduction histidine kinase